MYFFYIHVFLFQGTLCLDVLKEMQRIQHTLSLLLNALVVLVAYRPDQLMHVWWVVFLIFSDVGSWCHIFLEPFSV